MSRTPSEPSNAAAVRLDVLEGPEGVAAIVARLAERAGRVRTVATVRSLETDPPQAEIEIEVDGLTEDELVDALDGLPDVQAIRRTRALGSIFGKRVIVVGGGAQVAQVALGAVSEADRHNLRGERISVDTIPLVGEANIAAAVRAVADLPRARLLVLAGSIMGGDISRRGRRAAGGRRADHRPEHGRLDHRSRGPRRLGSRPGRHDGRDGDRRHGDVRPREAARPPVLRAAYGLPACGDRRVDTSACRAGCAHSQTSISGGSIPSAVSAVQSWLR